MRRLYFLALLSAFFICLPRQQSPVLAQENSTADEHRMWIAEVLRATGTIKPGMTRADLLRVFTTEGGLGSRRQRRYVYQDCPYIKVDVKFAPVGNESDGLTEAPENRITEISHPFLEYSIFD